MKIDQDYLKVLLNTFIKDEFRDSSLSTLKSVASSLLTAFARKQLNEYFQF